MSSPQPASVPMSYDCCVRIEPARNGYELCTKDPAIVKANASSKGTYKDPNVEYVFKTKEQVLKFLTDNFEKLLPMTASEGTFDAAYDEAVGEED